MRVENKPLKVRLTLLVFGSFIFFLTQLLSGNLSGCIALQAYSYHVLSDALSLFVGLLSVFAHRHADDDGVVVLEQGDEDGDKDSANHTKRGANKSSVTNTYGWARIEPVGALISHITIISLSFSCCIRCLQFLIAPGNGLHRYCRTMLAMGGLGVVVHMSVIFYSLLVRCCTKDNDATRMTTHTQTLVEKPTSPPVSSLTKCETCAIPSSGFNDLCLPSLHKVDFPSLLLHTIIGLLASVLIVVDALVHSLIHHHHFWIHYVDPCIALVISAIIIVSVIPSMTQSARTLIQHTPEHIDVLKLQNELRKAVPEIAGIHEFHVWRLEGNIIVATIHIVFANLGDEIQYAGISKKITEIFRKRQIEALTLQPEFLPSWTLLSPSASSFSADDEPRVPRDALTDCASSSATPDASDPHFHVSADSKTECLFGCPSSECAGDTCCGANVRRRLVAKAATCTGVTVVPPVLTSVPLATVDINTNELNGIRADECDDQVTGVLLTQVTSET